MRTRLRDDDASIAYRAAAAIWCLLADISDRIALNRSLPDVRRSQCRERVYPPPHELPTTSVIIIYHNEAFSTLLRTVTSVILRSPREALHEIILVDDFSNRSACELSVDSAAAASSGV